MEHCSQEIDGPIRGRSVILLVVALAFGAYAAFFKSNVPSDEEIDAAFGNPQGYSYEEWSPEAKDIAEKAIADNPEMADLEVRFDGRMVRDGVPLGTVVIIGMDPAELEGLDEEVLPTGSRWVPACRSPRFPAGARRCTRSSFRRAELRSSWIPKTDSWSQWQRATWRACRTSRRNWPRQVSRSSPPPQPIGLMYLHERARWLVPSSNCGRLKEARCEPGEIRAWAKPRAAGAKAWRTGRQPHQNRSSRHHRPRVRSWPFPCVSFDAFFFWAWR